MNALAVDRRTLIRAGGVAVGAALVGGAATRTAISTTPTAGTAATAVAPAVDIPASALIRRPATTLWSDGFGYSRINPDRWGIEDLPYSAGNVESQWYRPDNVMIGDGSLRLVARSEEYVQDSVHAPEMSLRSSDGVMRAAPMTGFPHGTRYWTSGLINTRDADTWLPLFTRIRMRARVPHGQGVLPAFWLRRRGGASWGEVDIMESFGNHRPGYTKFTLHFPNTLGTNVTQQHVFCETPVRGTGGVHDWEVEIRPAGEHSDPYRDPIEFIGRFDGTTYAYYKLTDEQTIRDLHMLDRQTGEPVDAAGSSKAWDVCVNMAVGGRWVGQPDQQLGYLPIPHRESISQRTPPGGDPRRADTEGLFFVEMPATYEIKGVFAVALDV